MNLNNDLILRISMVNASNHSMNVKDRLVTARRSSQVCRLWRSLIIGYSPLWARLILINNVLGVRWMKEVIERAGSSLMWVKVTDLSVIRDSERRNMVLSLLFGLLTSGWDRIESFELEMQQRFVPEDSDRLWSSLSKYALVLRVFKLSLLFMPRHSSPFYWQDPPDDPLDGDPLRVQAPLLHTFTCRAYHIPVSTTWLRGLTVLEFTPYSTKHALDIISLTPMMESLKISFNTQLDRNSRLDEEFVPTSLPPHLSSFHAVTTFQGFVDFWRNIALPLSGTPCNIFHGICLRHFDLSHTVTSINTAMRMEAMTRLLKLNGLRTSSSEEGTALYMELAQQDATLELQPYLRIAFSPENTTQLPDGFMYFFNDLLSTHFTHSTHLTFGYDLDDSSDIGSLLPWLLSLTSVEDITVRSEQGLRFIKVLDNAIQTAHPGRIIFPNLRTMNFVIRSLSDTDFLSLISFIQIRNTTNYLIETINIKTTQDIADLIWPIIVSLEPVELVLIDISTGEKMGGGSNYVEDGEEMHQ